MGIRNAFKGNEDYIEYEWVSVPLRGNGYKELLQGEELGRKDRVSVPLRGNGYKEPFIAVRPILFISDKFPSPCGEMGIRNSDVHATAHEVVHLRFRPLAGKWV